MARFLPLMNDMDLEQFFSMTAKCRSENNVLWNAAVNHLKSPIYSAAVDYIVEQVNTDVFFSGICYNLVRLSVTACAA